MISGDFRYTLRTLVKQRSFTIVAVLTLAIALAANTAIFSVVNAILLKPLPYAAPDRLVDLTAYNKQTGNDIPVFSYPNFIDIKQQTKTLEEVAAFSRSRAFLMEGDEPELTSGIDVTANLPQVLGVQPQLGRFFNASEDQEHGPEVLVISHELWQRRFNGDPNIVGRGIRFGSAGKLWTVLGVMPEGFRFPVDEGPRDWYGAFTKDIGEAKNERDSIWISVFGKMKPGVSVEQAAAELKTLAARLEKEYPAANADYVFTAAAMHEQVVKDVRPALLMLFGAVAVVLLIGCANVANLLLARATSRHKEISIRSALGASRARITLQLLVESVVLSLLAGAVGLLLASWGIDALLAFAPPDIPRLETVSLDGKVLLFTTLLSVFTGIAFGLAPAISASRPNLTEGLKEGTRGSTEGKRNRLRSVLVVAAVALSLMLLAGAGLLMRSFIHVTGIDPGYDHRNAIALEIAPRTMAYPDDQKTRVFFDRLLESVRALPGVEKIGAVDSLPLGPNVTVWSFRIVGRPEPEPGRQPSAKVNVVTPGLFETLRIPVLRGRDIATTDHLKAPPVMVVNEAWVREHFPNENPVGRKIQLDGDDAGPVEIVGVVGDVRWNSLTEEAPASMYFPHAQRFRRYMSIVVRGPNAETLAPALREIVRRIDAQQPIVGIATLAGGRRESLAERRFSLILLGVLAVLALVLAAVGIFSVMNYSVTQRTAEIGIRMALGAEARDVFRLIVGHAARLVLLGTAIGVVGALLSGRAIGTLLYGVKPADPWTFAVIVGVIATVALVASYIPARRASRVDPLVAIRYD
jgi:putative ABC transport system permease protein